MDKPITPDEESTDQPNEKSTPDETQEESQDQPNQENGNDNTENEQDGSSEELITIDGEQYTPEEAKELLSKGKHFTYEMQQLRARERELQAMAVQPNAPLSEEEREVQEARQTLKKYGVVTQEELNAKLAELQQGQALQSRAEAFRATHPEVNDFTMKMLDGAVKAWGLTYEEAYKQSIGSVVKSARKKVVGASSKANTPVSNKGGGGITRADIAKMSMEEYNKKLPLIEEAIRKGELQ